MRNTIFVIVASFLLISCSTGDGVFDPKSSVRIIHSTTYPEFPNIEPLPDVNILPWEADVPRDTSVLSVKNTTECRKVETYIPDDKPHVVLPKEEQDPTWWSKCGEHPILPNSNIYLGFEQDQWNIIVENFAKLKERVWQYKQRIKEVNRQREEWRKKAEEERKRLNQVPDSNVDTKDTSKNNEKDVSETKEKPSFFERLFN